MTFIRKDVFKLALPILTEQLFVMSLGMVNTMMAGHINKEAVSAIGMVDSINNIFIAFFSALAVGGTVVVAQYAGKKNIRKANEAVKQSIYSAVLISIGITIVMWIFIKQIIIFLYGSADVQVVNYAHVYFKITLIAYPAIALELAANGALRGAGDTKTPMKITMFMNVINLILGYCLIYGLHVKNFNIPSLGVEGAAVGISVARVLGAVLVSIVLLRGTTIIKLSRITEFKFESELLKPVFQVGIPASLESFLFNGGKLITQIFIVNMGTASIAANTITNSITIMLNIPGMALSIAATALVGQYMGRGDGNGAESCLSYLNKMSTICIFVLALASVPAAGFLTSLYTKDSAIIQLCVELLKLNALFIPLWSISFVLPAGLKGAGDAKYTLVTSIIGMWIFRITMGYILGIPLKMGLIGVWLGMYIDWLVRGILYYIRFKRGKWKSLVLIK
ncbi:MATE family efflux transporter [Clostridium luticellarii]|uniref:Probable multidrug resistance protein NorM n=1 Tax=Clostridium luticellarii TaxID=1691940 RepID=A0A2T0BPB3_9CLOT|nr:MATE family efflux transporter [Clostridium luticellarii]PRR85709.1 Multidrug resistance protein NorM [Clostridium luticellarii]